MDSITDYINQFSDKVQQILQNIRNLILENAPDAVEEMAYGMPGYKLNQKPLVYFAAYRNHIGFYATPSGHLEFKEELAQYKQGKGSVQFPLGQPIPYDLIKRMVVFRVKENQNT
ncbi:iron chaperone [Fontibacter flavus]|uniref:Iron chaperone n=1 Tax=Fontibacter flavus TaxID=654838 RepID=A0ABV6FW25_9BACT